MAFTKVQTKRTYFKYAECTKGQVLVSEGIYTGPEEGKFGVQHLFKQKNGEVICLNSSGHLNWLLEEHGSQGMLCNVVYDGKVTLTAGKFAGKDAHNFELGIDEDYIGATPAKLAGTKESKVYAPAPDMEDISL